MKEHEKPDKEYLLRNNAKTYA